MSVIEVRIVGNGLAKSIKLFVREMIFEYFMMQIDTC